MPKGYPRAKIDPDADGIELPTSAEVARWKASLIHVRARIKGLSAKEAQLAALIAAAGPQPPEPTETASRQPKERRIKSAAKGKKGRRKKTKPVVEVTKAAPELPLKGGDQKNPGTWTSVIHNILREAGRGLLHSELRAEVAKTDLATRLANSDKGFYGGIAKLADEDPPRLVKYKGRLFDPPTHEKFMADVEAGRTADLEELPHMGNASPFRDAILEFMRTDFKDGATSGQIIDELKKNPALISTVLRHPTHTYNVLARMITHGELTKWNEKYFLGPKEQQAA